MRSELAQQKSLALANTEFVYQPFYCEENIWHLSGHQILKDVPGWVLMISNAWQSVAMAHMKICEGPRSLIFWDYHVVWLGLIEGAIQVVDLDSKLPFPVDLAIYLSCSFPALIPAEHLPMFRLIDAEVYREKFSSDRRHMLAPDHTYRSEPPDWPAIFDGKHHLLMDWLDFDREDAPGTVLTLEGLNRWGIEEQGRLTSGLSSQ
jgi:hypothetical protein